MPITTACARCGENFEAHSFKALYCSGKCRNAAYRERKRLESQATAQDQENVTVQASIEDERASRTKYATTTLAELQKAGVDGTALAQGAIVLAVRIDAMSAVDPPAGLVALVKEHAAAMTRALGGITVDSLDPFDELARRREERRKAAGG